MNKNLLLPIGFEDLIFERAEEAHKKVNIAIKYFLDNGFRLVKPSIAEFSHSFDEKQFESFDRLSGQKIVFRLDITKQIKRIATTSLRNQKLPMKLCYVGDILCQVNDDLQGDRQQTQIGIELIGHEAKEEESAISLVIETLKKIKVKDLIIEFSIPRLLKTILNDLNLQNNKELIEAIEKKDLTKIKLVAKKHHKELCFIILNNGDLEQLSKAIKKLSKSKQVKGQIETAKKLKEFFEKKYPEVKCCFDLLGEDGSGYHTDFSFDIFGNNLPYKIASGGTYEIELVNKEVPAIGSTIYLNRL